jgi:hypothetical protein
VTYLLWHTLSTFCNSKILWKLAKQLRSKSKSHSRTHHTYLQSFVLNMPDVPLYQSLLVWDIIGSSIYHVVWSLRVFSLCVRVYIAYNRLHTTRSNTSWATFSPYRLCNVQLLPKAYVLRSTGYSYFYATALHCLRSHRGRIYDWVRVHDSSFSYPEPYSAKEILAADYVYRLRSTDLSMLSQHMWPVLDLFGPRSESKPKNNNFMTSHPSTHWKEMTELRETDSFLTLLSHL